MKRFVRHLLRFVMAVFLVHPAVQNAAAFRVLRSASELGYPPFALVTPGGVPDGFSVELLKAVAKQVDMGVAFGVGPWQSIKQALMDGKIDVLVMRGDTAHDYALRKQLSEHLVLTKDFGEAFRLLASGKHDAVIVLQIVGRQLMKQQASGSRHDDLCRPALATAARRVDAPGRRVAV